MDYKKDLLTKLPELKNIEGFPIGKDEDIIALSEPPYFTACPNPYIADFIKEHGTPYNEETDNYHCEPFVSDVSEGKSDPIYMAHTYHTYSGAYPPINSGRIKSARAAIKSVIPADMHPF